VSELVIPAVVRGGCLHDDLVAFDGRGAGVSFRTPDPARLLDRLPLQDPGELAELYTLRFDDIVDYLAELGRRLVPDRNPFLAEALDRAQLWSDMTPPLVRASYEQLPEFFAPAVVREVADTAIGIARLEGWDTMTMGDGRSAAVRAMGARAVHIIAGNSPLIAALSIVRSVITRGDAVIKAPSNDPLTAVAIARTMVAMAPDHPITRHVSVAHWNGGTENFERHLYQPAHFEKIVAWGGLASVRHVTRYIQARTRTRRPGPQAQRHHHRRRGVRRPGGAGRGGPQDRRRRRRAQPIRLRQRPGDLGGLRHRR
jgi:hypothetical protein